MDDPPARETQREVMNNLMVAVHENNRHIDDLSKKLGDLVNRLDEFMTRSAVGQPADIERMEEAHRKLEERMNKLEKRLNMVILALMKQAKRPAARPAPQPMAWPPQPQQI
jgi:uncharacterized coiled-coil protein SlyX